jgi:presenilin 1
LNTVSTISDNNDSYDDEEEEFQPLIELTPVPDLRNRIMRWRSGNSRSSRNSNNSEDRYGLPEQDPTSAALEETASPTAASSSTPYTLQQGDETSALPGGEKDGLMRDSTAVSSTTTDYLRQDNAEEVVGDDDDSEDDDEEESDLTISMDELLYSASSYHAIAQPVSLAMILSALAVVLINNDDSREAGQQAMANAYEVWSMNGSSSNEHLLALSLANALVMVSFICCMTFVIVCLYKMRMMKCLIGYMMITSTSLLCIFGGNVLRLALNIYNVPVDKVTFVAFVYNFGVVGVLSIFFGFGIPKLLTQAYLIATSVILAWHLSYFDEWTTWALLFMLAIYDLCAVLTPCGPLKFLVEAMQQDEAPEMPGLLFEAELPPEIKKPGNLKRTNTGLSQASAPREPAAGGEADPVAASRSRDEPGPLVEIPLAIAKVYSLKIESIPPASMPILLPQQDASGGTQAPLLQLDDLLQHPLPEDPTPRQLRALVTVRLPVVGGRIEPVTKRGKKVYLERDRHGNPKRVLWVDHRTGKVFAEMRDDDSEGDPEHPARNTIRLGLGDFIFYSVLTARAALYSFTTFAACCLVILAGLGGTLILLSVYHHALPALPISIFLGVAFYLLTRFFAEPWIESVLMEPYYV